MSITCKIAGHKWRFSSNESKCIRCGFVCNHEKQTAINKCSSRCLICKNTLNSHNWVLVSEDGLTRCSVCGEEHVDQNVRSQYDRKKKEEESKRLEREAREKEERIIKQYLNDDGTFRCMVCGKNKPMENMNKAYNRPVCNDCSGKLKEQSGHLVFQKCSGYETKITCIRCLKSEEYKDAELQGSTLQSQACKL